MAGLGKWNQDEILVFGVNTHDVDTGVSTDTSGTPSYRVYKNEDGTPVATGNMAKLDDANTTGFYTESLTLSKAAGYSVGNVYTIYIQAEVDTVNASMNHFFRMVAAVPDPLTADAVSAIVATAILNYDPPTESEMSASFAALNDLNSAGVSAVVQTVINTLNDPSLADISANTQTIVNGLNDISIQDVSATVEAIVGQPTIKKGVQLTAFPFLMVDATDFATPETGLTVSGSISKDGAAYGATTNSPTELANGTYLITLTATEMNADTIALRFTAAGAADRFITIVTQP